MNKDSIAARAMICATEKGYIVSEDGDFYSPSGAKLRPRRGSNGYLRTSFRYEGKCVPLYIHQMQAYKKFGLKVFDTKCVRHLNGNRIDNSSENIGVGSHSENRMDMPPSIRLCLARFAALSNRKFTDAEELNILNDHNSGLGYNRLSRKYSVSKSTINYILRRLIA